MRYIPYPGPASFAAVLASFAFALSCAVSGAHAASEIDLIPLPAQPRSLAAGDGAGGEPVLTLSNGARFSVTDQGLEEAAQSFALRKPDMLPDGGLARGAGRIRAAWFGQPTTSYTHGVLGDQIEAEVLYAEDSQGAVYVHELRPNFVFEDLTPRLWDVDGDQDPEIIAIRVDSHAGAMLSVFDLVDGELVLLDETRPIGRPFRWLNPLGAADLDGDGRIEIVHVRTPHIGGILVFDEWREGRLVAEAEVPGFSTHVIGSRELALGLLKDLDGDGIQDILLPDQTRRDLVALSYKGGQLRQLWRVRLPSTVATNLVIDGERVLVGLTNRNLASVPLPRVGS